MVGFRRRMPQIPVVLAFSVLWVSFAWALPADTEASDGEDEVALEDRWAGVKISDAYDYAKCPRCGKKNEIRAETCSRCGWELPQPSADVTDPYLVFVPGRGYFREGEMIEPGRTRAWLWVTGLVIGSLGAGEVLLASAFLMSEGITTEERQGFTAVLVFGGVMLVGGVLMTVVGLKHKTKPVYAFHTGELDEGYEGVACAGAPRGRGNVEFKIEMPVLSF